MTVIAILSPGHPTVPGGVTDHTGRLVRHWSQRHEVVVASDLREAPDEVVARWAARGATAALIQYVPFLYGRRGVSRYPERVAVACARAGIRVTVFVHEPWVPLTRLPWLVTGPLQRIQLHRLIRRASASATPVPAWQNLFSPPARVLYVGSNLGEPPAQLPSSNPAPLPAPVVFSPYAAGLNWHWILAAVRAINSSPGLIVLGATEQEASTHLEVKRHVQPGWDWRGRLPGADILAFLARAPLVLAPFIDGLTGRRGSASAAFSVGTRILSSSGPLFDPFFLGHAEIATSEAEFAGHAARIWADGDSAADRARRREWHDRTIHPQLLDERLLGMLLPAASRS
jgi:hypothetical protein